MRKLNLGSTAALTGRVYLTLALALSVPSALILSACSSEPQRDHAGAYLDVSKILLQVNDAVVAAMNSNSKFPPVTSVTLDLQVSVATTLSGTGKDPMNVIVVGASTDHTKLHHINLTFIPNEKKSAKKTDSLGSPRSTASASIPSTPASTSTSKSVRDAHDSDSAAYVVASATPTSAALDSANSGPAASKESELSRAIQAVYATLMNAGEVYQFQHGSLTLQCTLKTDTEVGVNFLGLVPLEADTKKENDTVQSLTLNFGTDPSHAPATSSQSLSDVLQWKTLW